MNAHDKRREVDLKKLQQLSMDFPGVVEILEVHGNPMSKLRLRLILPTAGSENFPSEVQGHTDVLIDLPSTYPLGSVAPKLQITTPIWNPNVYRSGLVCKPNWIPTEGLDLFVLWLMKLLAYESEIVNTNSPANTQASSWYESKRKSNPSLFPTFKLLDIKKKTSAPKIQWTSMNTDNKTILSCPSCKAELRVNIKGVQIRVTCTKCKNVFEAQT